MDDHSSSSMARPLCTTHFEELISESLVAARTDVCPMCAHPAYEHTRAPTQHASSSLSTSSHTSPSINREALKALPRWKIDFHHSRTFLDRMEQIFYAANLPESEYTKQLLLCVSDVSEANYIKENILDHDLSWSDARAVFQNHFDVFNIVEQYEADYEKCKKMSRESAQHYSDRYLVLCTALNIADSDTRAINHFIHGLDDRLREEYKKAVNMARLLNPTGNEFTSLKKVIAFIISLEMSHVSTSTSHTHASSASTHVKASPSPSPSASPYRQPLMCANHPNSRTHTTADCKLNAPRTPSTPFRDNTSSTFVSPTRVMSSTPLPARTANTTINNSYTNNNSNVAAAPFCRYCKQSGHYTNKCPTPPSPMASRTRSHLSSINNYSALSSVDEYGDEYEHDNVCDDTAPPHTHDNINNINTGGRVPNHIYNRCRRERLCFKCEQPSHIAPHCTAALSKNEFDQRQ